jgi:acyl carrier protein
LDVVAKILAEAFGIDAATVTPETTPDDVEKWDSLGHMNMVAGLESAFTIQFEIDEIMEMASVAQILKVLEARGIPE